MSSERYRLRVRADSVKSPTPTGKSKLLTLLKSLLICSPLVVASAHRSLGSGDSGFNALSAFAGRYSQPRVIANQLRPHSHCGDPLQAKTDAAPNQANAIKFIEFLSSDLVQEVFAAGNNEYPVVEGVAETSVLGSFGDFKEDELNAAVFGNNNEDAVRMMDRAGWR